MMVNMTGCALQRGHFKLQNNFFFSFIFIGKAACQYVNNVKCLLTHNHDKRAWKNKIK